MTSHINKKPAILKENPPLIPIAYFTKKAQTNHMVSNQITNTMSKNLKNINIFS